MIEPMACSRTPKCSTRPYGPPDHSLVCASSGRNDGSPSGVVLLLSARSAEPPQSSGSSGAIVDRTVPDALRVAMPFSSASNVGSASVQPVGQPARGEPVEQRDAGGVGRRPRRRTPSATRRAARGRGRRPRGRARAPRRATWKVAVGVEAEDLLRRRDLVGAERGAVGLAGVLLVGRRPADDGPQRDERRPVGRVARGREGVVQRLDVLVVLAVVCEPVDPLDVPAVGLVARADVLGERDRVSSSIEMWLSSQSRTRLPSRCVPARLLASDGDALLEVAVGGEAPDGVVERALPVGGVRVEQAALAAGGHGHADGVADALAERAGRRLDAGRVPVLGVAGRQRAPLAQVGEVLEGRGRSRTGSSWR